MAVITDAQKRVLITKRAHSDTHGGCWEFPGGKLEAGETPDLALMRELREELGIGVVKHCFLTEITHHYDHQSVVLMVYRVTDFVGEPACLEQQQDLRWVSPTALQDYAFPAANLSLLEKIKLQLA